MSNRDFHVWDGVYASFAEAHGDLAVFNAAKWLERSKEKALALRERFTKEHRTQLSTQDYCLPLLAAVCGASLHRLRILDFGGALGFSFFPVRAGLPAEIALNFEIVEQPALVRLGRELFADERGLSFHDDLDVMEGQYDIVHCGSVLQYVEDWKGLLQKLCEFRAPFLVLDDIPAGNIETYVTLQHYFGKKIPCWFWNLDQFITRVRACGYRPIFQTRYVARILGKAGPLPMGNLPEARRLEHAVNIVFKRQDD